MRTRQQVTVGDLMEAQTNQAAYFAGLRNQLVENGWSDDGAEELITVMVAQGRA